MIRNPIRTLSPIRLAPLAVLAVAVALPAAPPAAAQEWSVDNRAGACDRHGDSDSYCEVRTATIPADGGVVTVEGLHNGGISVRGWDGNEIRIRARVTTRRNVEADDVFIDVDGSTISARGPRSNGSRGDGWSVSFELDVPSRSDLKLDTHNGGIAIRGVEGAIRFETHNGGVSLSGLAGDVRGSTRNGGLSVELSGNAWFGEGLDVETKNGGVKLEIPEGYSADLETGTVNGRIQLDFPVEVQGTLGQRLSTRLGSGGAPVRVVTTNGGVRIGRP